MNNYRKLLVLFAVAFLLMSLSVFTTYAAGPRVAEVGNKHNLSSKARTVGSTVLIDNTNNYRAESVENVATNLSGKQVCIFCHTPHNANVAEQAPLWNRAFSTVTNFQRYSSGTLEINKNAATRAAAQYNAQPDGSSKLCLSCHDGVSGLGAVLNGGKIVMVGGVGSSTTGGGDVITGLSSFNPSTNKMKLGHHPVSFVYDASVAGAINTGKSVSTYILPGAGSAVKLDRNNKMQCSTCHDPHQNKSEDTKCYNSGGSVVSCDATNTRKVVPFWVFPGSAAVTDHDAVCTTCHPLTGSGMIVSPFPASPL